MKNESAIITLKSFINRDNLTAWKYAGEGYRLDVLAAEDSLNALLGLDAIRTKAEALRFAETLAA